MAPGASAATPLYLPGPGGEARLPRVDEGLLPEDSPYEIVDGQRVLCMAEPDHAGPQLDLAAVLRQHVAEGYRGMVELTTRADSLPPPADLDPGAEVLPRTVNELRSDASILKLGTDPRTGGRYVEDLSFEIANEQSFASLRDKARKLHARGVRRVFGLMVKQRRLAEWSPEREDFIFLREDEELVDACLIRPIKVKALLDAAEGDNAIAAALIARGNPTIVALKEQERKAGLDAGLRQAIYDVCSILGIEITAARRTHIEGLDHGDIEALRQHLQRHRTWPEQGPGAGSDK